MTASTRIRLEKTVVNPLLRTVLQSRLHTRASKSLVLLAYTGRRTGQRRVLPVAYAERADGTLVILAGDAPLKRWWRNLRGGADVEVTLRGHRIAARADVLSDHAAIRAAVDDYTVRFPRFRDGLRAAPRGAFEVVLVRPCRG